MTLLVVPMVYTGSLRANELKLMSCDDYSKQKVPKFRIARRFRNDVMHSVTLFISVAPRDISQDTLLTLGCSLGKTYSRNQTLFIWILDDFGAAKRFNPQGEGNDSATNLAFRASYSFSRERNEQSLSWLPNRGSYGGAVEISLGSPPPIP
jgi:hypothetical protein